METAGGDSARCVRVLCGKKIAAFSKDPGLYWLIGSPQFLPPFTVVSVLRCLHSAPGEPHSPEYTEEAADIKVLLSRGFAVVGALYVGNENWEGNAKKAVEATMQLNQLLSSDEVVYDLVGAAADLSTAEIHFFASEPRKDSTLEPIGIVVYEDKPEKLVWENSCLLRCQLEFKLPIYVPVNKMSEKILSSATNAVATKLRAPQVVYIIEGNCTTQQPVVFRGADLSANTDASGKKHYASELESGRRILKCSQFLSDAKKALLPSRESAETIQVTVFHNISEGIASLLAPVAEYLPALESTRLMVADFKLDVLCYVAKDFPLSSAILQLVIPGLIDQLDFLSKAIYPKIPSQEPQLCPYHFFPPGIIHPVTALYDLTYGETEIVQAEIRKSLHVRMGLPLDRPLLLISNALTFGSENNRGKNSSKSGSIIKDVHLDIPRSGVSGGLTSLIEGSYEYYHYLQDGFDDNGWGCAYRSLQTIVSWFRLQRYTTTHVPSHKEIQKALVEIGDKETSFVGSREWIGAIELSFVLDKLLGVSCKIINVRSGAELPEKCRELALHFETQGTPVMIGGGVLAYTLLGVDYNDASGDCAFLILDPHYTGTDDLKKIVNGGWCGWKKAVDSKGKNFFLHDKFYNLLLPQRPNMV